MTESRDDKADAQALSRMGYAQELLRRWAASRASR